MTWQTATGRELRQRTDHPVARLVVPDDAHAAIDGDSWAAFHPWLPGSWELGGTAVGPDAQTMVDALFASASDDDLSRLAWFGWERTAPVRLPGRYHLDEDHGGDWELLSATALAPGWRRPCPPTVPGCQLVTLDDAADAQEIAAFNAAHNPGSEGAPGEGHTRLWLGYRGSAGELLAVGAWQMLSTGTPYLAGLVVHGDHRGRGFGGTLLAELARRALATAPEVCLGVDADNASAIRLYERMGFARAMAFHTDDFVTPALIRVAAVIFRDPAGRVLAVRKRGTDRFMLPGGKPEAGEDWRATAVREVEQELGLDLDPARLVAQPIIFAAAANEPGHRLEKHSFAWPEPLLETPVAAAEIDEVRWFPVAELLDPTRADLVAPALVEQARTLV